jgi:hypothetical protein
MKQKITWKDMLLILTLLIAPGGFFVLPVYIYSKIKQPKDTILDD